jgi:hypothetical protein
MRLGKTKQAMKTTSLYRWVVLLCLGGLTVSSSAAQDISKTPPSAPASFLTTPFNPELVHLPTFFIGHDIVKVTESLSAFGDKKGEFETSYQFSERQKALASQPLFGNEVRDSTYAFALSKSTIAVFYDADNQSFDVALRPEEGPSPKLALPIRTIYAKDHSYAASNAFGATVSVDVIRARKYQIAFSWAASPVNAIHIHFAEPLEEARAVKERIGALALCQLVYPFRTNAVFRALQRLMIQRI